MFSSCHHRIAECGQVRSAFIGRFNGDFVRFQTNSITPNSPRTYAPIRNSSRRQAPLSRLDGRGVGGEGFGGERAAN
jgi:hypothetical protein